VSQSLSVLIVDDNPSMANTMADVLDAKGFKTHAACSGEDALAILRDQPVDILLTDVIMPGMSGLALFREARKAHPNLPTFFMTAYAADDLIQLGMKEGIKAVLNKPMDIEFLILMLRAGGGGVGRARQ
jgi:CheY-like chemotaxis protein